jgi:hypothetical protein
MALRLLAPLSLMVRSTLAHAKPMHSAFGGRPCKRLAVHGSSRPASFRAYFGSFLLTQLQHVWSVGLMAQSLFKARSAHWSYKPHKARLMYSKPLKFNKKIEFSACAAEPTMHQ